MPLSGLLPQAAPMVLLSGYDEQAEDGTVVSFVDVSRSTPFYEQALGGVPACVALEYMAQTMALLVGLTRRRRGLRPKIGFVLGSRKLDTFVPCFRGGAQYRVTATCTYEDDSFGSFDCEIVDADGNVSARATMTAFQPDDDITSVKLEEFA